MALSDRIESLKNKHAKIDAQLKEEETRPSVDAVSLRKLKALKLDIKDEIEQLMQEQRATA